MSSELVAIGLSSIGLLTTDPWLPGTVSQQFARIADQADVEARLHDLRHYAATQMLAGGIDLRTVAGRLGHSGGGAVTLRVYAHHVRPADQAAADLLSRQLRDRRKQE